MPITLGVGGFSFFCCFPPSGFLQNPQQARFITDTNNANMQNQGRRRLRAFFLLRRKSLVHSADGAVVPCFHGNTLAALLKTSRFVVLLSRRISRDCGGAPFYLSLDIDKPNVYASLLRRRCAYNDSRLVFTLGILVFVFTLGVSVWQWTLE